VNSIPLSAALVLGAVLGLLVYGPVQRWLVTLLRTLRDPRRRTSFLMAIFATLHPAPWLLLIGLPYGAYRLWSDPLRGMWACVLTGALATTGVVALVQSRARRRHEAGAG